MGRTVFHADLIFDPPSSAAWCQLLELAEALVLSDFEAPLPIVLVGGLEEEP